MKREMNSTTATPSFRILLSAYACEPGKGSEAGVGWHWAVEMGRLGHRVSVLTRLNNRSAIEAALAAPKARDYASRLEVIYYRRGRVGGNVRVVAFIFTTCFGRFSLTAWRARPIAHSASMRSIT
jgi:hypothetical protein